MNALVASHAGRASPPGRFTFFGLPGPPFPFFRLPRNEGMERREAPGPVT